MKYSFVVSDDNEVHARCGWNVYYHAYMVTTKWAYKNSHIKQCINTHIMSISNADVISYN